MEIIYIPIPEVTALRRTQVVGDEGMYPMKPPTALSFTLAKQLGGGRGFPC